MKVEFLHGGGNTVLLLLLALAFMHDIIGSWLAGGQEVFDVIIGGVVNVLGGLGWS